MSEENPDKNSELTLSPKEETESLVGLSIQGGTASDVTAFTKFYLATRASLRGYLSTILHNDAACEDCMQEAVLVVWKKRREDWEVDDFRKMAFTCARFKALSWLKKHKPAKHLNLSPELSQKLAQKAAEASDFPMDYQFDRIEALRDCIAQLPENQREMIKARYEDTDPDELARVAKRQKRKMNAVYKQLERTRNALRKCVEIKIGGTDG